MHTRENVPPAHTHADTGDRVRCSSQRSTGAARAGAHEAHGRTLLLRKDKHRARRRGRETSWRRVWVCAWVVGMPCVRSTRVGNRACLCSCPSPCVRERTRVCVLLRAGAGAPKVPSATARAPRCGCNRRSLPSRTTAHYTPTPTSTRLRAASASAARRACSCAQSKQTSTHTGAQRTWRHTCALGDSTGRCRAPGCHATRLPLGAVHAPRRVSGQPPPRREHARFLPAPSKHTCGEAPRHKGRHAPTHTGAQAGTRRRVGCRRDRSPPAGHGAGRSVDRRGTWGQKTQRQLPARNPTLRSCTHCCGARHNTGHHTTGWKAHGHGEGIGCPGAHTHTSASATRFCRASTCSSQRHTSGGHGHTTHQEERVVRGGGGSRCSVCGQEG